MTIEDHIDNYRDTTGFVQLHPGGGVTQNGQLWTALTTLATWEQVDPSYRYESISKWGTAMNASFKEGLYNRHRDSNENNSVDNLFGILAMIELAKSHQHFSWYAGGNAFRIYSKGEYNSYNLWNVLREKCEGKWWSKIVQFFTQFIYVKYVYHNPNYASNSLFFAWWGKMPGAVAAIKIANDISPSTFEALCFCVGQIISAFKKDQDLKAVGSCATYATKRSKSWLVKLGNKIFSWKLNKDFKGKELGEYLRTQELDHPMRVYWQNFV